MAIQISEHDKHRLCLGGPQNDRRDEAVYILGQELEEDTIM